MRGRPSSRKPVPLPNRIRELRDARGMSQSTLGKLVNATGMAVSFWETGQRRLKAGDMERLAAALGVAPGDLLPAQASAVPVVGRVGAGAEIIPIDDHAKGEGLYEVECPRGLDPKATVAVEVVGDSMAPAIMEGWVLFYDRAPEPAPSAVVGKLCVVKLEDGRVLVKQLRRGPERGRFNLVSLNGPMIEDVALEWAAPVKAMLPREIVGGA
jgi:transcriptional regulator with XRE-family HTH domain